MSEIMHFALPATEAAPLLRPGSMISLKLKRGRPWGQRGEANALANFCVLPRT